VPDCLPASERDAIARDEATSWRVWKPATKSREGGWRIVDAPGEKEALRKVRGATVARPILPTRRWVELGPPCGKRRRKR